MPQSGWKLGSKITLSPRFINKNYFQSRIIFKFLFFFCFSFFSLISAEAQFLRNLLQDGSSNRESALRDDPPLTEPAEELLFEEIICRDLDTFPKKIRESSFTTYSACKLDLDRIENATYIDLTYRIRRDNDRLDLYLKGFRQIYICDGGTLSLYEHEGRQDPDWWMISRNSLEFINCDSDEIVVDNLD